MNHDSYFGESLTGEGLIGEHTSDCPGLEGAVYVDYQIVNPDGSTVTRMRCPNCGTDWLETR